MFARLRPVFPRRVFFLGDTTRHNATRRCAVKKLRGKIVVLAPVVFEQLNVNHRGGEEEEKVLAFERPPPAIIQPQLRLAIDRGVGVRDFSLSR